jgi:hypothetical protein
MKISASFSSSGRERERERAKLEEEGEANKYKVKKEAVEDIKEEQWHLKRLRASFLR